MYDFIFTVYMNENDKKWGFLRETKEKAKKAGLDADTGLCRTGLEEYLYVIFPNITDWVHDKSVKGMDEKGKQSRKRPDYRSETLKLVVEFDGIQHYQDPEKIIEDNYKTSLFQKAGYKVVRIPYFIQLTKKTVKTLFGVDIPNELFDENIPSLGIKGRNTPLYLSPEGIKRMAKEFFEISPEQYKVNVKALTKQGGADLTGVNFLEEEWDKLMKAK